jgi:hyperosmotically inducible protein
MQEAFSRHLLRPILIGLPLIIAIALFPACKGKPKAMDTTTETTQPAATADTTAPQVRITPDDALIKGVTDATKDFPELTASVKDGVVSVTGETTADRWKKLKMALDELKPKKVDASGIKIKP